MGGSRIERAVVDASVAVLLVLPGTGDPSLLHSLRNGGTRLYAPSIIASEVAAAITKNLRLRQITRFEAQDSFSNWEQLLEADLLDLIDANSLLREAFDLSVQLHHALHDCIYVALAKRERATFITCDKVFARKAGGAHVNTEVLG
ncbi:MAG: type II toxin-antitoxin system VapC family toxin [Alphaproteobacteria bacterium]|nr:type II toxin-antitoxin system VapC family toxin [Alphaproteobacteria bacterium]MBV9061586.1 type II toxin-antitoxin system VapC family toxin [Alphaproteobacteria bacterium]